MEYSGLEIAIIGMSGRFPGASDLNSFWNNLKLGKESISRFSKEELENQGIAKALLDSDKFIAARGVIDQVDKFDPSFFGFTNREAELLDPQVRIFIECVYEALESGGVDSFKYNGKIGLFAGANPNLYWKMGTYLSKHNDIGELASKDLMSTRIAYKLNLKGPCHTVYTACSTALVTVHQACRSLLSGECDMALAGGVSIDLPQITGYVPQEGLIFSNDGHNRSYDANASGTLFSNGAGVVLLKPLEEAIADGDAIQAVIKGSAINNDGNRKVSFTAPSVKGQAEVISEALQMAQVAPESIQYIEGHGSATDIGDPIEIEALQQAFGDLKGNKIGIGSVKSNIGHLNIASGVAGLIKTVLSLQNECIPSTLHFNQLNPKIKFRDKGWYIVDQLKEWKRTNVPRRAGVSSFGVGGTNAHVILEEAPARFGSPSTDAVLVPFSAKSKEALVQQCKSLHSELQYKPVPLDALAYTLQTGRAEMEYRFSVGANSISSLLQKLALMEPEWIVKKESDTRKMVFLFPGQGSQYLGMVTALLKNNSIFRAMVESDCAYLQKYLGLDLLPLLTTKDATVEMQLNQTRFTQPLLYIVEMALANTIMRMGIAPQVMLGHSLGEYVAATVSGVFNHQEALLVVAKRAEIISKLPKGDMLAIQTDGVSSIVLPNNVSWAAYNAKDRKVASGTSEAIAQLASELDTKNIRYKKLPTSHAFHSAMMDEALPEFEALLNTVQLNAPKIPFLSNLSGEIAKEEVANPKYWVRHLRQTVQFEKNLSFFSANTQENYQFVEVGPGTTLTSLVGKNIPNEKTSVLNLLPHAKESADSAVYFAGQVGKLWQIGYSIQWDNWYKQRPQKVNLPTYPFQRKSFWLDETKFSAQLKRAQLDQVEESTALPILQNQWVPLAQGAEEDAQEKVNLVLVEHKRDELQVLQDSLASNYAATAKITCNNLAKLNLQMQLKDQGLHTINAKVPPTIHLIVSSTVLPELTAPYTYSALQKWAMECVSTIEKIEGGAIEKLFVLTPSRESVYSSVLPLIGPIRQGGGTVELRTLSLEQDSAVTFWPKERLNNSFASLWSSFNWNRASLGQEGTMVQQLCPISQTHLARTTSNSIAILCYDNSVETQSFTQELKKEYADAEVMLFEPNMEEKLSAMRANTLLVFCNETLDCNALSCLHKVPTQSRILLFWYQNSNEELTKMQLNRTLWYTNFLYTHPNALLTFDKVTVQQKERIVDAVGMQVGFGQFSFKNSALEKSKAPPALSEKLSEDEMPTKNPKEATFLELKKIWETLLGCTNLRSDSNFFASGGDSLLVVLLLAKIEKQLEVKIELSTFYQTENLGSLAALISTKTKGGIQLIPTAKSKPYYPTTSAQATMFYLQMLHPDNTAYNITKISRLAAGVDTQRLKSCWKKLIERHENLRTIFAIREGAPVQVILPSYEPKFQDLKIREIQLEQAVEQFTVPFDLQREPGIRLAFFKSEEGEYMVLDIHHIICDAVAIDVLNSEMNQLYFEKELVEKPLDYKDFSVWQTEAYYQEMLLKQREFWMSEFSEPIERKRIAPDFNKKQYGAHHGAHFYLDFPKDLSEDLLIYQAEQKTTLFALLLAGAYLLLSKNTETREVVIGTGTLGRNFPDLDRVVGNFVNTVALKSEVQNQLSFSAYLKKVNQTVQNALHHQDYPYETLINELPYNKGKKNKALFQMALTLVSDTLVDQKVNKKEQVIDGFVDYFDQTSKFEIDFNAVHRPDGLALLVEYSNSLYKQETIEILVQQYFQILANACRIPEASVEEVLLLELTAQ